jgi:hypothetical protein
VKQKKSLTLTLVFIILGLGTLGFLHYHKASVPKGSVTGTVTSVIDRPNQAEDGYYSFDLKSKSGQQYTVNATAYLNTPVSPDSSGEDCVGIPKVKVGDKVEFNLPKSQNQPNLFDTCYKQGLAGYYFKLN